jgi:hypothetical protein
MNEIPDDTKFATLMKHMQNLTGKIGGENSTDGNR